MAQLRDDYQRFVELDAEILVVGPENKDNFSTYFSENDLPFVGLPDPNLSVIKLYGQEVNLFKWGRMPAMLIIDKNGYVRFVHYGHSMSDIPSNEDVIDTLIELGQGS